MGYNPEEDTVNIYIKYGHVYYMTEGGEMMCPPFVKNKAQAERFLGESCMIVNEMPKKRGKYVKKKEKPRIAQYDKQGNLIAVFDGMDKAVKKTGYCSDLIWKCCKGVLKSTHGVMFRYVKDNVEWKIEPYSNKK